MLLAELSQLVEPKVNYGFVGNIRWRTELSPYVREGLETEKSLQESIVAAKSFGLAVVASVVQVQQYLYAVDTIRCYNFFSCYGTM